MIRRRLHESIGTAGRRQLLAAAIYLAYVLRLFNRLSPLILAYRQERQS